MIYNDVREQLITTIVAATTARRSVRDAELAVWDDGDEAGENTFDSFTGNMVLRFEARGRDTDNQYGTEANAVYAALRQRLFTDQTIKRLARDIQITEMTISPPESESNVWGFSMLVTVTYRHTFDDVLT